MTDLSAVKARDLLKPKANRMPYWHRLRPGCFVGYRPSSDGAAGNWAAKAYVNGVETQKALESFGQFLPSERFAKAKAAAEAYMALKEAGDRAADAGIVTVADACRKYAEKHPEAAAYFKRRVDGTTLADIKLDKLRRANVREWRADLDKLGLAESTVSREIVPVKAAIYGVKAAGTPDTEAAWQEGFLAEKADKKKATAKRRREVYLDRDERQALLANCSAEIEPFLRALCLLPVRPGAMAQLVVGDFNKKTRELTIREGIDKDHPERLIHLNLVAAELFAAQCKGKTPAAPIFGRADLKAWNKDTWKGPVKAAVVAAKLDPKASAYTLRHCVITDLINLKVPVMTIAQIGGTSVKMIEEHYAHLLRDAATAALDMLAL